MKMGGVIRILCRYKLLVSILFFIAFKSYDANEEIRLGEVETIW